MCDSVFHVVALSPRPGRGGATVGAGPVGTFGGDLDGSFAEPPVDGTGSAGAAEFNGDDADVEADALWASHFV